jgi:hypothetical protein
MMRMAMTTHAIYPMTRMTMMKMSMTLWYLPTSYQIVLASEDNINEVYMENNPYAVLADENASEIFQAESDAQPKYTMGTQWMLRHRKRRALMAVKTISWE